MKKPPKKQRIEVWLPPSLVAYLRQEQRRLGVPISQVARAMLEQARTRAEMKELGLDEDSRRDISRAILENVTAVRRMQERALAARGEEGRAVVEEARQYAARMARPNQ